MDWATVGISLGALAVLGATVVGFVYLFKKNAKAKEVFDSVVEALPLLQGVLEKFVPNKLTHDILNSLKHLSKTAAFMLENKDATFEEAKPLMEEYVKSCLEAAGMAGVSEDVLEAEMKTAFMYMKDLQAKGSGE